MVYNDMPVIIPLLATGYLLTIYLLLILAQRTTKNSRYAANSLSETYTRYLSTTENSPQLDKNERWSLRLQHLTSVGEATPLVEAWRDLPQRETVNPKELAPELQTASSSRAKVNG
jgi:hypothetical protein